MLTASLPCMTNLAGRGWSFEYTPLPSTASRDDLVVTTSLGDGSRHLESLSLRPFRGSLLLLAVVLGGYLLFSRAFAYVRVPGMPVFIGDLTLAILLLQVGRVPMRVRALVWHSVPARMLTALLVMSGGLVWVHFPAYGIDALRDAAPMLYGLYSIAVAAAILHNRHVLPWLAGWYQRVLPWFLVWAPISVYLGAAKVNTSWTVPGSSTSIFSFKPGDTAVHVAAAISFLWLIQGSRIRSSAYHRALTAVGFTGLLAAGSINRGGLAAGGVMLALTFLRYAPRRGTIAAISLGVLSLLVAAASLTGVRVELGGDRDVSLEQVLTNVVATIGGQVDEESNLKNNVRWRLGLWGEVFSDVQDGDIGTFGLGVGPNLANRYGYATSSAESAQQLRSVHNSHLTILARWGVLGAALWLAMWLTWVRGVDRVGRSARSAAASLEQQLAAWVIIVAAGMLVNGVFDAALEGPHASIWLWVIMGIGLGICGIQAPRSDRRAPKAESTRAAGVQIQ